MKKRVNVSSIVELKRRFATQPRAVRCGGSSRACQAPAKSRRKARRERPKRPLLYIHSRFFRPRAEHNQRPDAAATQPHQPSAATVHRLATNGETGEPRANHKQAHTDNRPRPETKRKQTTPNPAQGVTRPAAGPRGRAEAAPLQAAWHAAQTKEGRRPEKPRPAGAAHAFLFLLGAGKNRLRTASSKPRKHHGRTTYFPVPEPAGDTPTEGIAAAPHRTAQANPIRANAALTRLYEYNITLRYTFINLV